MNIQHLRYFKAVAECENMRKAAEELMIAQPALSKCIRALETEVGVKFFIRAKQRISLNDYGRRFYYATCEILEQLDTTLESFRSDAYFSKMPIKFWVLSPSTLFCSRILMAYSTKNPMVQVNMIKHHSQVFDVEDYDLILFSQDHANCERLIPDAMPALSEEICLAVNVHNPLAQKDCVTLEDVLQTKLVAPSSQFITRIIKELNLETNVQFLNNIIARTNSPLAVREFLENEPVASFVPSKTWCLSDSSEIKLLPIKGYNFSRVIYLYVNGQSKKRRAAEELAKFILTYVDQL